MANAWKHAGSSIAELQLLIQAAGQPVNLRKHIKTNNKLSFSEMERGTAIEHLEWTSTVYRRQTRIRSIFVGVLSVLLAVLVWPTGSWGISLALCGVSISQLVLLFLPAEETRKIIQLASSPNPGVVWIYPMEWAISPFGVQVFKRCYLKVHKENGHVLNLRVPPLDRYEWMPALNALFPEASFGFTDEREKEFRNLFRNPGK